MASATDLYAAQPTSVRPPDWSVASRFEGTELPAAVSSETPTRSRTVESYSALVRRGICEVTATPGVQLAVAALPPLPNEPPEPIPPAPEPALPTPDIPALAPELTD